MHPIRKEILSRLGMVTFLRHTRHRIDTGNKDFNAVLGNRRGLPSGKIYEIAGIEHAGKTLWCLILGVLAQIQCNAIVIWIDLEGTWDWKWAKRLGMKIGDEDFYLSQPVVVKFAKKQAGETKKQKFRRSTRTFLQTMEWTFQEIEEAMAYFKEKYPDRPLYVCYDSVANMYPESKLMAGAINQNMNTNGARAAFLSSELPKWAQLISNYDGWLMFINQIRTNPAQAFGDPRYTPGGKGLAHNAHSRSWFSKIKGGRLLQGGKVVGIKGIAVNKKNKTGGGSEAYLEHGFQIRWDKTLEKGLKFMSAKDAAKDGK